MLTDKKDEGQFVSKRRLKNLFTRTEVYHKTRRLKVMFRDHYCPNKNDDEWTSNLTTNTMNDIRLHLSWELGVDTYGWSREKVAETIVSRYKKLGIFLFLRHVIINDLTR